jgi:hypothetical protein
MNNYRNRGESFRAIHFNRYNFEELWSFTNGAASDLKIEGKEPGQASCQLKSYYGDITVREGDYVFSDTAEKNYYALPADYFESINEIVENNFKPPVIEEEEPTKK